MQKIFDKTFQIFIQNSCRLQISIITSSEHENVVFIFIKECIRKIFKIYKRFLAFLKTNFVGTWYLTMLIW